MATNKYLDGDGVAQVWQATKDYVAAHSPTVSPAAETLMGDASTDTWSTRTSTGSGAARIERIEGNAEVIGGELVPVSIEGIRSVGKNLFHASNSGTAQSVAWSVDGSEISMSGTAGGTTYFTPSSGTMMPAGTYTMSIDGNGEVRFDGTVGASVTKTFADEWNISLAKVYVRNGITYAGTYHVQLERGSVATAYKPYTTDAIDWAAQTLRAAGSVRDELTAGELVTRVGSRAYQSGDESDSSVVTDMTTTFYPLTTPTTTPISPALPMTYKVQQGGTEAIVVPEGEISAAPIITVAEGKDAAAVVMDALAAIAAPDGPTATANHALNTYLTMGGKLYKVTSAIAVGETIAPNTNVSETTVMAELIARTA